MTHSYLLIDPQAFEEYYGGIDRKMAVDLYAKTAEIFIKNMDSRLNAIEQGLKQGLEHDLHLAMVTAHQLKGSLLSLGGKTLAESFRQIELNINVKPLLELQDIFNQAKLQLKDFVIELSTLKTELESTVIQHIAYK